MDKFNSIEQKVIFQKLKNSDLISETVCQSNDHVQALSSEEELDAKAIELHMMEITNYLETMTKTKENYADRYLTSSKKVLGGFVIFIKRVTRWFLRWYINPIVRQQSAFNSVTTPAIGKLTEISRALVNYMKNIGNRQRLYENKMAEILTKLDEMELRLAQNQDETQLKLERQNCHLQSKLEVLNQANEELKGRVEIQLQGFMQNLNMVDAKIDVAKLALTAYKVDQLEKTSELANIEINKANQKLELLDELNVGVFKTDGSNFWNKKTVSQSGEDVICFYITMMLGYKDDECTYIDLGANHAKDMSNTYYFYSKGARGVLVEANPALIPELKFYRNGDIILNKCVSDKSGEKMNFYVLNGDGLSTPSLEAANEFIGKNSELKIVETVEVESITVNEIIERYLGKSPVILNIDLEGDDMKILSSIDFEQYRPLIVIVEMIEYQPYLITENKNEDIIDFMKQKDYTEYAFTGINSIFLDKTQLKR